jgi:hypothetical protein
LSEEKFRVLKPTEENPVFPHTEENLMWSNGRKVRCVETYGIKSSFFTRKKIPCGQTEEKSGVLKHTEENFDVLILTEEDPSVFKRKK